MLTLIGRLSGRRIAILATNGFELTELEAARRAFEAEGARTFVVAPQAGEIQGWHRDGGGERVHVDLVLSEASADAFDGLMLPGGVRVPEDLASHPAAVHFVRDFADQYKPIVVTYDEPWRTVLCGYYDVLSRSAPSDLRKFLDEAISEFASVPGNSLERVLMESMGASL